MVTKRLSTAKHFVLFLASHVCGDVFEVISAGLGIRVTVRLGERELMNVVCRRLMTQHLAVPALTNHDSLLTKKLHVEQIRSIVLEEF